jgi:osmotically-inducible protein OsmY
MVRLPFVVVVLLPVSLACSGEVSRHQPPADRESDAAPEEQIHKTAFPAVVPENEADREIRRTLNLAIAQDAVLKDRQISFIVSNGDVSVSGIVRNEDERQKINELALNIDGVKSVANALRVAE